MDGRTFPGLPAAMAVALLVGGCASPNSYMGIDTTPEAEQRALMEGRSALARVALARRAKLGDKQAQVTLGILFEHGIGVERDWDKARKLYRSAASDSGGQIWVYSPPVGDSAGRVIPVDAGRKRHGLPRARELLERLKRRMETAKES